MIKKALKEANKGKGNYRIGAVITDKQGKVLSKGYNVYRTHPKQSFWAKKANQPVKEFLHAEIAALVKCKKTPFAIYIARKTKTGVGLAKPCSICQLAINHSGIKEVYYTL